MVLHPDDKTATVNGAAVTIESPPYVEQGTTTVSYTHLDVYKRQFCDIMIAVSAMLGRVRLR